MFNLQYPLCMCVLELQHAFEKTNIVIDTSQSITTNGTEVSTLGMYRLIWSIEINLYLH